MERHFFDEVSYLFLEMEDYFVFDLISICLSEDSLLSARCETMRVRLIRIFFKVEK